MSLRPSHIQPVPEETARVARTAFRKGNPLLQLRDELGSIFRDEDFADLFPRLGQPGLPPWRLALVTLLQFRENLADRQAAEAVRARIDWKYLLGLELDDPGFDYSVLSEFRSRLLEGSAEERLLHKLLEACQARGLLKARGRQRTDATHVLASIRTLNRLELVGETLRAALNELATTAPDWLRGVVPEAWHKRYARRIEDDRLPTGARAREVYAQTVGEDGFMLLDLLGKPETPEVLRRLPKVTVLRRVWQRHFLREGTSPPASSPPASDGGVRLRPKGELPPAAAGIESPYDPEARYRRRGKVAWAGYIAHLTETCTDDAVHLLTHVMTTVATVHEARCTATIHQALAAKGLPPGEHLVDAAYIDAELLVRSRDELGISLIGPGRPSAAWQTKVEDAFTLERFVLDWEQRQARCPRGKLSSSWSERVDGTGRPYVHIVFRKADCDACSARAMCTRAKQQARNLKLSPRAEHEALQAARGRLTTEAGKHLYARRAGIEGTISQGVRAFGLRRSRYRGLAKTHLQHVATATAINLERLATWFQAIPRAVTRTSRFAALSA
jgi:transposase